MSLLSPYRVVLRTPYACGAFVASLAGRLCYGIVSLSLILTLTAGGRDYGLAGLVMAVFGLTIVVFSPLRASLIDRYGPRRTLPPMAAGFAAPLLAVAAIHTHPDHAAIVALAAAAGACAPPLGVVMRAVWSTLISDRAALQTAYSLDGVVEELLYVAGPVIAGAITVAATPAVGLIVSAGLAVGGTALFIRSPAVRRWPSPVPRSHNEAPRTSSATRGLLALTLVIGGIGLCLGGLGLVIVAFSQARRDPAAVAWIEAVLATGSALGGLGYGAVTWRISAQHRLTLLAAGLAIVLAATALSPGLLVLAVVVGLAGVLVSPALATAYALADGMASERARTRAGNWVSTGYNAGTSAGAALTGQLIGRIPLDACLPLLAAALLALAGLTAVSTTMR